MNFIEKVLQLAQVVYVFLVSSHRFDTLKM